MDPAIRHVCSGCGHMVPASADHPFRCPEADGSGDVDHVLARTVDVPAPAELHVLAKDFRAPERDPFVKYRKLLWSHAAALERGVEDAAWVRRARRLGAAVERVCGAAPRVTPFERSEPLAEALAVRAVWVKDETLNAAGSHKARHLMGVMVWLEVLRELGAREPEPLAIASCGNAALAAAVVARAAGRRLRVFVPGEADGRVVASLERLGAETEVCERQPGVPGDPSLARFRQAVSEGALPFTCQGSENGLVVEGGQTLAFEMVSSLLESGRSLDRVIVQVGGGALGTAVARGFFEARALGLVDRVPRFFTVQPAGVAPLARAYDRIVEHLDAAHGGGLAAASPEERSARLRDEVPRSAVEEALRYAARHRSEFMWPWEEEPRSLATGILDDETYDWHALVRAMLLSGGYPLVVPEPTIAEAHRIGRKLTGISASPTGTAGLAGGLELRRRGVLDEGEEVAVLFTGVSRASP